MKSWLTGSAGGATGATGASGVIAVTAPITNSGTSTSANIGVDAGSTSAAGVLQLTDSTSSTSTTTAATPNAVKTVYDFAAGTVMPFVSGYYYKSPSITASQAATAVVNTTYYTPFFVPVTTTFDRIAVRTGNGYSGTGSVRMGIYGTTAGKPSTLILDAGTGATTSANQTVAITISQQLTPGVYFVAANSQTAATTNTFTGPQTGSATTYIGQPFAFNQAAVLFYSQSSVTGAFANASSLSDGVATGGIFTFLRAA